MNQFPLKANVKWSMNGTIIDRNVFVQVHEIRFGTGSRSDNCLATVGCKFLWHIKCQNTEY